MTDPKRPLPQDQTRLDWARLDRRSFLGWAALAIGCKGVHSECAPGEPIFEAIDAAPPFSITDDPFALGVASGDPLSDRVIIWTRIAPAPTSPETDYGAPAQPVPVVWRVAEDEAFTQVISQGLFETQPQLAHAVHVDVVGLQPDRWYYYRFEVGDHTSPVGRTRTLPCADAAVERLRFAFASCQRYRAGYYTAHAHLAQEDLDLVFFLGDYIYESRGNSPIPERDREQVEATDLEGYRGRYGLYKSDPNLQAAHQRFPWIVTWDDHEVDNDYASDFAGGEAPLESFIARRAAGYQAFYEHMPIRLPQGLAPEGPERAQMQIYRGFEYGDLASMYVLDTRQYRDKLACGGDFGPVCAERDEEERSILGAEQEAWLHGGLRSSAATWRLIAQQVVMATLDFDSTIANFDQWDGYTASRQRLLDVMREIEDVVVLSGDIHVAMVADLTAFANAPSRIVGTELICPSVTSGGDEDPLGDLSAGIEGVPNVRYISGRARGYVRCEMDKTRIKVDLRRVSTVLSPSAEIETEASWEILKGTPGAEQL